MKLRIVLVLFLATLFSEAGLKAQDAVKTTVDQMPTFPGCDEGDMVCARQKMAAFVNAHIQMPDAAKEAETGGVAMVAFVVGKNGKISDVVLKKDPGFGMGAEAVRLVNLMQEEKIKWEPGREDGKKVDVQMVMPVSFSMSLPAKKEAKEDLAGGDKVYSAAEIMPRFSGCAEVAEAEAKECTFNKLIAYVRENLKYPEEAREEKTEGMVMTSFVVNEQGGTEDVRILKSVSDVCDEEAKRVIMAMPAWTPGQQGGENVKVQMTLPIQFKLGKSKDPDSGEGQKSGENK